MIGRIARARSLRAKNSSTSRPGSRRLGLPPPKDNAAGQATTSGALETATEDAQVRALLGCFS